MKKKMKVIQTIISVMLIASLSVSAQQADEAPAARRFQEVVADINTTLDAAKKAADRKQAHLQQTRQRSAETGQLVENRAAKITALRKARDEYEQNKSPDNEEALHNALLEAAKVSTDVLERLKDEVVIGAEMVDNVREKFASVLIMFEELENLSEELNMVDSPERQKAVKEAEDRLYSVIKMTDVLGEIGIEDPETKRILSTIEIHAKRLNAGALQGADIQHRLNEQRKNIEHLYSQLSVVRERLEVQKSEILRLTLGQIVHNMLLKLSSTMLAAVDVNDLPLAMMGQADQRDGHVRAIERQNAGLYGTSETSVPGGKSQYSEIERIRRDRETGF